MPHSQFALRVTAAYPNVLTCFRILNCWQKFGINLTCVFAVAAVFGWSFENMTVLAADAESIYKNIAPSIVMIEGKNEVKKNISQGTGFVIDQSQIEVVDNFFLKYKMLTALHGTGFRGVAVLTNFHVIESAVSLDIRLSDGATGVVLSVLAENPKTDLALLWCLLPQNIDAPGLKLSSDRPQVGSAAHVIGCPKGQAFLISSGIISGFGKDSKSQLEHILHSVPISPGSSGAPLVDKNGGVVGIVSATIEDGQNLNIAVFASDAIELVAKVTNDRSVSEGRSITAAQKHLFEVIRDRIDGEDADEDVRDALKMLLNAVSEQDEAKIHITIPNLLEREGSIPSDLIYAYDYCMGHLFLTATTVEVGAEIERAKRSTDPMGGMRTAYRSSVSHSLALRHFEASFIAKPEFATALFDHVKQLAIKGEYQSALYGAETLVKRMPYCYEVFRLKAEILVDLGRHSEAKIAVARACQLNPRDSLSLFTYGNILSDLNEYKDSASAFLASANEDEKLEPFAYFNAAGSFEKSRQYRKAIELYEHAITLDPSRSFTEHAIRQIRHCQEMLAK